MTERAPGKSLEPLLAGLVVPPRPAAAPRYIVPPHSVTRFAPAPTGALHLGHLVNALHTWGIARASAGRVLLRIEDHDRQRSRRSYELDLLDDLDRLGLAPDEPSTDDLRAGASPFRQSDSGPAYAAALERLREADLVYACDCARSTFAAHTERTGAFWEGPGCPGGCRARGLEDGPGRVLRAAIGSGREAWLDLALGSCDGAVPGGGGDPAIRDRHGNWTYAFCVVVDDLRHGVDLVIRGADLVDATAVQIRLATALGRPTPPRFLHHPLVRSESGAKLSKSDGSTSVRSLLDAGWRPEELFGAAARLAGLTDALEPVTVDDLPGLFAVAPA